MGCCAGRVYSLTIHSNRACIVMATSGQLIGQTGWIQTLAPMKRFLLLSGLLATSPAQADWIVLGAAAQCASDGTAFSLVPVVKTGDGNHDIRAPAGSHEFAPGSDQVFQCNLGKSQISLVLSAFSPQERGMGQGAGGIVISSLVVDGRAIIAEPTNFNWQALDERVLTKVLITKQSHGLASDLCYSSGWDWERPYADQRCEPGQLGR